jgi:glycosyltransferase involved in cell wall biosynthesis
LNVSAVVSALNEEKTIQQVIDALLKSKHISEVIVINDGSTDTTPQICRSYGSKIIFLDFEKNRGMGYAMAQGLKRATSDIVAFFDADLLGLNDGDIGQLIEPLLKPGRIRAVLGHCYRPEQERGIWRLYHRFLMKAGAQLTGQRAYYREDILPHAGEMEKAKRGAVIVLNSQFKRDQIHIFQMKGVTIVGKEHKMPLHKAIIDYAKEFVEFWRGYRLTE